MARRLPLIVAVCCLCGGGPVGSLISTTAYAEPPNGTLAPCEQAGLASERAAGLPAGLLLAIGRVESGRWDASRARVTAWPWAINAAGKGQWFDSPQAATDTVRALLDGGTSSIDVGCFQINLMYHPTAFANLEQAFDPVANATYAARFLVSLFGRTGSWEAAVGAYHSADPTLGFAYRQLVFSTWTTAPPPMPDPPMLAAGTLAPGILAPGILAPGILASVSAPKRIPMPMVIAGVQIWSPMLAGGGPTVVAMPPPPGAVPDPVGVRANAETVSLPVVSYRVMPRR
jgi:hypothetical protein